MPFNSEQVARVEILGTFISQRVLKPKDRYLREEFAKELIDTQELVHGDMSRHKQAMVPKYTLEAILKFLWRLAGAWYWLGSEEKIRELFTMVHYFAYSAEGSPSRRSDELDFLAARVDQILPIYGDSTHDIARFSLDGIVCAARETGRIIFRRTEIQSLYFPQWLAATLELLARNYYGGPELAEFTAEMSFNNIDWSTAHAISEEYVYGGVSTTPCIEEGEMRRHDKIAMAINGRRATRQNRRSILAAIGAASTRRRNANNDNDDDDSEQMEVEGIMNLDEVPAHVANDDNEDNMAPAGE